MHLQAEYGFAAHWRYKEGDCEHLSFVLQVVEWARWVISWQCEAMSEDSSSVGFVDSVKPPCTIPTHSKDCTFSCKPDCGLVFVILIENDKINKSSTQVTPFLCGMKNWHRRTAEFSVGYYVGCQPRTDYQLSIEVVSLHYMLELCNWAFYFDFFFLFLEKIVEVRKDFDYFLISYVLSFSLCCNN